MVIVAGHLTVEPSQREDYLSGCVDVVREARKADGCLDFALSADLIDAGRINILERWESAAAVEAFRGSGVGDEQGADILHAAVAEYDVAAIRALS
jgi:quinol monooxygenase YgiN